MIARVGFEAPDGGDQHGGVGRKTRDPALDVEETLCAHVGAEARLGDEEVAGLDADLVGDDRGVARGDVAERSGVYERRRALEGLHQVRLDGFHQQHGHRPGGADVVGGDRCAVCGVAQHDASHAGSEVVQPGAEGEGGHHLGRGGDVEAGLSWDAIESAAESGDDVAQRPVVDVEHSAPTDLVGVEAGFVAVEDVGVEDRRAHVVGRGHGMHVAGEMEVERLHRHDLAVTATGGPALDAEGGTHRRLANGDGGRLADVVECLAETDGGGGLALAERSGGDRRDDDVGRSGMFGHSVDGIERDLGCATPVRLEQIDGDVRPLGDLVERSEFGCLGDLEITGYGHGRQPTLDALAGTAPGASQSWPGPVIRSTVDQGDVLGRIARRRVNV